MNASGGAKHVEFLFYETAALFGLDKNRNLNKSFNAYMYRIFTRRIKSRCIYLFLEIGNNYLIIFLKKNLNALKLLLTIFLNEYNLLLKKLYVYILVQI